MVYEYNRPERLFTGHTGRLFLLITSIWLFVSLSTRLLPPLLPAIIDDLAITAGLAGIALTAERMVRSGVEFPSGRAADDLSRTTILLVCIAMVIVGLVVLSLANVYIIFLFGLMIIGAGRGMYSPAARALLSDIFQNKRGRAFGINMLGSEISGVLAAGIAVLIVGVATWRTAFIPLAILLIPLMFGLYILSRESIQIDTIDLRATETGLRLFGDSSIRLILIVYCLYVLAASGISTFLPLFLIDVHGVSFAIASSAFALLYATGLIAKPVMGYLSDIRSRLSVAGGSLYLGAGGLAILIFAPSPVVALGGVVIYAFGYRGLPPGLQAYLMDSFPDDSMAGDLGAMRTVYMFVGSLGPAYAGLAANTIGFVPAFLSFLLFYLIGGAILILLPFIEKNN